ncbi:MAG: TasA family protein [Patescibacteria group bacterium]
MKKILINLSIVGAVAAIAIGATTAYFSDTETSTGNTFTAGTIDIAIDQQNPWTSHYSIGDLKPGETGYINFDITNVGTNPVNVSKTLTSIAGTGGVENYLCANSIPVGSGKTSSEPECVAEAGTRNDNVASQIIYDLSVKVYAGTGDANLIWWQAIYTDADGKSITDIYGQGGGNYVALGMIPVGGHMKVTQSYNFSSQADNKYQGDAMSFDITIKGDQMAQAGGYTSVALENKSGAPAWDILLGDGIDGTLNYKTQGPKFDYNFTGKVKTTGDYTLLYVGSTNNYPGVGSVVLGTGSFTAGTPRLLSGQVVTGSISSGKIWLIPSSSYGVDVMTSWPESNILFETGLINYVQN